jgi:outer membrane protein OmpA-like peptidoglycan-associated protein
MYISSPFDYPYRAGLAAPRPVAARAAASPRANFAPRAARPPAVFGNLGRRRTLRETISGFSRYRQEVASLSASEQSRLDQVARLVVASHTPGRRPIVTIRIVGHADFDTPRRPVFESRISADRALSVLRALVAAIDRQAALARRGPLSGKIRWERFAMGATRPLFAAPRTEAERARNRRVDILLDAVADSATSSGVSTLGAFYEPPPACTDPSPPQKTSVKAGGIKFDAEVKTTAFNPMPLGFIQQFVFAKQQATKALRFSCHRVEARQGCPAFVIPAWGFDGAVSALLPAGEVESDWEYGFIQTVQSSRILHVYDGNVGRQCVIATPTRDALRGAAPPWMQAAAVTTLGSATPASLEDSPNTIATIDHPTQPNLKLKQVCIDGVYLIWLAARKKTASTPPVLLLFKQITVGRTWQFIAGRDPLNPQSWVPFGGQFESLRGDVTTPNAPRPKLDGPTANSQVDTCFQPVTAKSCKTEEQRQFLKNCIVGGSCGGADLLRT